MQLTRTRRLRSVGALKVPLDQSSDPKFGRRGHVLRIWRRLRDRSDGRRCGARGVQQPQLSGLVLFLRLLPPEGHLGRHHPLSFRDQGTFRTIAVAPAAVALVALKGRDDTVVPAPCTLRRPLVALGGSQEESGRNRPQDWMLGHQGLHVHPARKAHLDAFRRKKDALLRGHRPRFVAAELFEGLLRRFGGTPELRVPVSDLKIFC